MMSVAGIVSLIMFAACVILITTIIYLKIYKKRINEKLHNPDEGEARQMHSPIFVFIVTLIGVMAVTYIIIIVAASIFSFTDSGSNNNNDVYTHLGFFTLKGLDDTPLKGYMPGDEISGYRKFETVKDDIVFTYYISKYPYDSAFPQILFYITEDETYDIQRTEVEYRFVNPIDSSKERSSSMGMTDTEFTLFSVNTDNFMGELYIDVTMTTKDGKEIDGHLQINYNDMYNYLETEQYQ